MDRKLARKRRYRLEVKARNGTITAAQQADLARLVRELGEKSPGGRPHKRSPTPAPPAAVDKPPPLPPAPGVLFDVSDLESEPAPGDPFQGVGTPAPAPNGVGTSPSASAPKPATPKPSAAAPGGVLHEPTASAKKMARKVMENLLSLGGAITRRFGLDPFLGLGFLICPTLESAWATSLDLWGVAGKLDELGAHPKAAQVSAIASLIYLGGGGLYCTAMDWSEAMKAAQNGDPTKLEEFAKGNPAAVAALKKFGEAQAKAAGPELRVVRDDEKPQASAPEGAPRPETPPAPLVVPYLNDGRKEPKPLTNEHGVIQMGVATRPPDVKQ